MILCAGLRIELELAGEPAWLAARARPGSADHCARIELRSGQARELHPLRLLREGARLRVLGDGLAGSIGPSDADLSAHGGDAGLRMALRLCSAVWGSPRGILLLHGACTLRHGSARAHCGPSGAGKTTLSRLLAQHDARCQVLSDEVAALDSHRAVAHGHPFQSALGDGLAPDEGAPLESIDFLEQAARTSVAGLSPGQAARLLLPRIFLPLRDLESIRAALDAAERLLAQVPARRFAFAPDQSAVAA